MRTLTVFCRFLSDHLHSELHNILLCHPMMVLIITSVIVLCKRKIHYILCFKKILIYIVSRSGLRISVLPSLIALSGKFTLLILNTKFFTYFVKFFIYFIKFFTYFLKSFTYFVKPFTYFVKYLRFSPQFSLSIQPKNRATDFTP